MSRGPVVEAMVQVGDMEIPYVCAGRGPTILVLEHPTADVDQRVWEGWTARYRLIRTRLPIDEASAPRIVALVEGLGLERPPVLLAGGDGTWLPRVMDALDACGEVVGFVWNLGESGPFALGD